MLVLLGEPGIGKSALLADLLASPHGTPDTGPHVLRTAGVESEALLPFAALHRLIRPVVDVARLPAPQARALRVAFGIEDGPPVDPFLVGLATLSVLTDAAANRPLLCVVDDAHWLDSASADALLFAARQLGADPVVIVFAARSLAHGAAARAFRPDGLPTLELAGLGDEDARRLLEHRGSKEGRGPEPEALPSAVADRLVHECAGNPLALLELPTGLSPAQRMGRAPLPPQLTVTAGVERAFLDRCRRLSEQGQTLMLVAAADDTGRVGTVREAAAALGVGAPGWEEAERSGLLTVAADGVSVQHSLVRSAVYQAAPSSDRRRAHLALADALRDGDPDRATWHRAAAADRPDERLGDALHEVGVRSERRGGFVAAAGAFERAAALTVEEPVRATRLFGAARNAWACGESVRAGSLASAARELARDGLVRADIDRLRARIEVNVGSAAQAHRILVKGARAVVELDPGRALEMATAAALTRTYGGDSGTTLDDVHTVLLTESGSDSARTRCLRLLLAALAAASESDWARAAATLDRALDAGRHLEDLDVLGNLGNAALNLGDDAAAAYCYGSVVSDARDTSAGMVVIYGLERLAFSQFLAGKWTALRLSVDESLTLARSVGQPALTAAPLAWMALLGALTGTDDIDDHLEQVDAVVASHPLGIMTDPVHDLTRWAKGTHAASLGDPAAALHHLGAMRLGALQRMAAVDRISAAVRAGDRDRARAWTTDLAEFAAATRRPWALAAADLGRALTADASEGVEAAELFESALGHDDHASRPFDRARAELAYGECLRRVGRRVDARAQLRAALETFTDLGALPSLDRATQELRASGETARPRHASTVLHLTPMERTIARLVSTGLSNKEVAARCWVSPRTVAFHLRNVFAKLGISSRGELGRLDLG